MTLMLVVSLAALVGALLGTVAGALLVRQLLQPEQVTAPPEPPDEFTAAEIDRAAAAWAHANGRPEAAGLMADKLHLLWRFGQRRQRP
jgi:hypothetical protein